MKLLESAKEFNRQQTDGIPYKVNLQVGAEYFVSTNVDVQDGLFNGSTGQLKMIEKNRKNNQQTKRVWMDFRNSLIGIQKKTVMKKYQIKNNIDLSWVPIDRIKRNINKTRRHGTLEIIREQFPLVAANGMTLAKSQGSSIVNVVAHIKKYLGKVVLAPPTGRRPSRWLRRQELYVICSRSTSHSGLFIDGEFQPPEPPPDNDPVMMEMARLREIEFPFSIRFLNDYDDNYVKIYFHNVQSFFSHREDVIVDHCAMARYLKKYVSQRRHLFILIIFSAMFSHSWNHIYFHQTQEWIFKTIHVYTELTVKQQQEALKEHYYFQS